MKRPFLSAWTAALCIGLIGSLHTALGQGQEQLDAKMDALTKEVQSLRAAGVQLPLQQFKQAQQRYESASARGDMRTMRSILMRIESALADAAPKESSSPASEPSGTPVGASGGSFAEALEGFVNYKSGTPSADADGYIGVGYTWNNLAKYFEGVGADYAKAVLVSWGKLEPRAPLKDGKPTYTWRQLDDVVKEYQDAGFELQMVLKSNNPWAIPATKTKDGFVAPGAGSISALPEPKYQAAYARFIASIVERYDGDGFKDMPGLKYPLIYWEIESEAFHEGYWRGTVEEYGEMLKIAYEASKAASPDSKIILAGLNFSDAFDDNPTQRQLQEKLRKMNKLAQKGLLFMRKSLTFTDYYDVIEIHYNRDYRGLPGIMNWLHSELGPIQAVKKEIWAGDTLTTPWLFTPSVHVDPPFHEETIYQAVKKRLGKDSKEATWFRAEQARLMVKKLVIGAEQGLKKNILLMMKDRPQGEETPVDKNWMIGGLIDRSMKPRPAFYALEQISPYLKDFSKVSRVRHGDRNTYIYKIEYSDGRPEAIVAWSESKKASIPASQLPQGAMVTEINTSWKPDLSSKSVGSEPLALSHTPIVISK
ncbi:MAG: hypothetical protein ACPGN3_04555 [Opitutales bacterium]